MRRISNRAVVLAMTTLVIILGTIGGRTNAQTDGTTRVIVANVVALDEAITYNRFGTVSPQGMIYALRRDVEGCDAQLTHCRLESEGGVLVPGQVRLRQEKRPRPLVLRMNVWDVLQVNFTNLLAPDRGLKISSQPATRSASVHVVGMQLTGSTGSDGSFVGRNASSLAEPGETKVYRFFAEHEGSYLLYSDGAIAGGEGNIGSLSLGLFGAVNVEPRGAEWYRSQVTHDDLLAATKRDSEGNVLRTLDGHPVIDFDARYVSGRFAGAPVLKMLEANNEIVHSDLAAIVTGPNHGSFPPGTYLANGSLVPLQSDDGEVRRREEPFREFTILFHDSVDAVQSFPQFRAVFTTTGQESNPLYSVLRSVQDGFALNYGMEGMGAEILANRLGVGPAADCTECKSQESTLSSWVQGDPALVVDRPANLNVDPTTGQRIANPVAARKALYPDDPSNVYHSYLNDHVKIRNLDAGREAHRFHLHAHQWLLTPDDDNSSYLDSQSIGPGASYTYEIAYNGTGNRNLTPGDSIFHCQFSQHLAQGMWGILRAHDTFEEGTQLMADPHDPGGAPVPAPDSRALPDGEIVAGTPIPALVPLPGRPMAPVPGRVRVKQKPGVPGSQIDFLDSERNPGYPFFVPGIAGHRPPQPPLDFIDDGGLPRHVITGGAAGDSSTHHVETRLSFDKTLLAVKAVSLPEAGTAMERIAMEFHSERFHPTFLPDGTPAGTPGAVNDPAGFKTNGLPAVAGAPFADPCIDDFGQPAGLSKTVKTAAFQLDLPINKVGWHLPQARMLANWEDVGPILNRAKPPEPFFLRAASNDCIEYRHTNLLPNVMEADDFQARTPTDSIGQHMQLVKADVTASDGSASGWNYEDGTFSPVEVQERIAAINAGQGGLDGQILAARRPAFFSNVSLAGLDISGAQTTIQRWYVDRTLNNAGEDRTLGTAFVSDFLGPSTTLASGLYGLMGVEPEGSSWRNPESDERFGEREDGGPTSFRADIVTSDVTESYREFFLAVSDSMHAYAPGPLNPVTDSQQSGNPVVGHANPELAINPPAIESAPLPLAVEKAKVCQDRVHAPPCPEAVTPLGAGVIAVNYRNEPLALRLLNASRDGQAAGLAGDLGFVYRSDITRDISELNVQPGFFDKPLTEGINPGDPYTPMLRVNQGDKVLLRLGSGAANALHTVTVHGFRWLHDPQSPNSGWRNGQPMGVTGQIEANAPVLSGGSSGDSPVDHLYKVGASQDDQWGGAWGLLRVYNRDQDNQLLALPNNLPRPVTISNPEEFNGACPTGAPVRKWDVTAVMAADALPDASQYGIDLTQVPGIGVDVGTLVYNRRSGAFDAIPGPLHDPTAILYVRSSDLDSSGRLKTKAPVEPLILRAAAGECVEVTLHNNLPPDPNPLVDLPGFNRWPLLIDRFNANQITGTKQVGLHPQLLSYDGALHDGVNVGSNGGIAGGLAAQTVGPGGSITYRWYAGVVSQGSDNRLVGTPVEFGATGLVPSDPLKQPGKGLLGALIIEPRQARWIEDRTSRASALVRAQGERAFREHVVVYQDGLNLVDKNGSPVPTAPTETDARDSGHDGLNYRTEPFWFRVGFDPSDHPEVTNDEDFGGVLSNSLIGGDPDTPIFASRARIPVRFRVVEPAGHSRNHVFSLHGHLWERMPYVAGSIRMGNNRLSEWRGTEDGIGPATHFDFLLQNGAGGKFSIRGDYLVQDQSGLAFPEGSWAIFRVQ